MFYGKASPDVAREAGVEKVGSGIDRDEKLSREAGRTRDRQR
jgi:hypothetical protein